MNLLDFLQSQRDLLFLIAGALIGFISSSAMWCRQVAEERKRRRADHILRAIHLSASSLTHARALLYSKTQGIGSTISLPENPLDELLAIARLHLHDVIPLVQRLHDKQQDLFGMPVEGDNAVNVMIAITDEMVTTVNELVKQLGALSKISNSK